MLIDSQPANQQQVLSRQVFRGGFWVFTFKICQQLLGFIRLIILARILAPDDFGLLGIALLTVAIFETFAQTGFGAALVQTKKDIRDYLDVSWTITVLRGIALYAFICLASSYIAQFFESAEAILVIQVVGLSIVIKAFINVGVVLFQKELEFKKQCIFGLSATCADFITAISAALLLKSVWALVFGCLAGNLMRFFVSYIIHPYRPRFRLDPVKARELFSFGKWVWGSTILIFLLTQADDIFVGKILGIAALGFYQMAYRISNLAATEIADVISQVTFPAYAKIQDDFSKLSRAYLKTFQMTALATAPIACVIFILAPEFTSIFLGDKWTPMVPAMQALALVGLLRSIAATTSPVFLAIKKPALDTKLRLIQLFGVVVLIYPLTIKWGIFGTSITILISICILTVASMVKIASVLQLTGWQIIKPMLVPMVSGMAVIASIAALKTIMIPSSIWHFVLFALWGAIAYLMSTYLTDALIKFETFKLIREIIAQQTGIKT
jgi:O-antigen/teichoic acid export membrane protein